jgi:cytoskeletal protein CcmA (bactofilin family)
MIKKMKNVEMESKLPNMIGPGTKIVGNIETNGDIRIDGNIEGNINSKGKVVVGNNGFVKGEVVCSNAEISGTIHGKMAITELLSLKASSKVNGDVKSGKLSIEPGALFTGTCAMGGTTSSSPIINREEKK